MKYVKPSNQMRCLCSPADLLRPGHPLRSAHGRGRLRARRLLSSLGQEGHHARGARVGDKCVAPRKPLRFPRTHGTGAGAGRRPAHPDRVSQSAGPVAAQDPAGAGERVAHLSAHDGSRSPRSLSSSTARFRASTTSKHATWSPRYGALGDPTTHSCSAT